MVHALFKKFYLQYYILYLFKKKERDININWIYDFFFQNMDSNLLD